MAYNSTIDKATDDILIYGNTAKDGSGTSYVPLLDTDGHTQVDVLSNALPTGASTLAEQQSQTTHLATIAGDTTAIETAVQLIDDTVYTDGAGTVSKGIAILGQDGTNPQAIKTDASGELQVDVLTMPTTTVTATDLDIRNLVNTDVVTAELSATDNAVLDAIAASVAAIDTDATTIIGHVDGIETLIGTTNSSLTTIDGRVDGLETSNSAIQTAVQLIDDTVQVLGTNTYTEAASKGITLGAVRRDADTTLVNTTNEFTPLQVDANGYLKVEIFDGGGSHTVDYATTGSGTATGALRVELPTNGTGTVGLNAGTNAIGKLAANSGVDIGDVDVTSIIPGTGATNAGKARDSIAGGTDTGSASLLIRRDSPTAVTPAAGDYEVPQISANGEQWVRLAGELADDAAFTVGTTRVVPAGLLADETSPDSVDEGDIGIPRMTLDRKAIVTSYPSSTTGDGLTVGNFNSGDTFTALTNTAQVVKASAGNFYGYYIYNPNSSATYVMLYNVAAASVTVGTTTPAMVFCIPATAGANLSLNYPIPFTNAGWSIAAATTGGGNAAPATALEAMIFYK